MEMAFRLIPVRRCYAHPVNESPYESLAILPFTLIGTVLGIAAAMYTIWDVARGAMRR